MPRAPARLRQRASPTVLIASPKRNRTNVNVRKDLAQKLQNKPERQLTDSDDSDRLVTKGHGGRRGRYIQVQPVHASGAVADTDVPGTHPSSGTLHGQRRHATRTSTAASNVSNTQASFDAVKPPSAQPKRVNDRSAAVAVPASIPRAPRHVSNNQPTPVRDTSILDGVKPRRRQPSILRATDFDDSLLNESFALPDDESTPLNPLRPVIRNRTSPLITREASPSSSRKSKLESSIPVATASRLRLSIPLQSPQEPGLPPPPLSALRASAQKKRQRDSAASDDIMAPPMSGSSSDGARSPVPDNSRCPSRTKKNAQPPPAIMNTQQLQTMMPSKRRKVWREVKRRPSTFEIPSDPIERHPDEEGDSSFLPIFKRRSNKTVQRRSPSTTADGPQQKEQRKSTTIAKTKRPTRANKSSSTRLTTPSLPLSSSTRSTRNLDTKSPSQQPSSRTSVSSRKTVRRGGFPLKDFSIITEEEKENRGDGGLVGNDLQIAADGNGNAENAAQKPEKKARSMWDEIDAWEIAFEEVSPPKLSSSPNAR